MFTIGADIEVFLSKDGELTSAIGVVHGTKDEPIYVKKEIGLSYDNVAAEFTVPVAHSVDEFVDGITEAYAALLKYLPNEYTVKILPSADFPVSQLNSRWAWEFGCDADYNVWTMEENKTECEKDSTLRTCGGHVHVGHELLTQDEPRWMMVRMMDYTLGAFSALFDSSEEALKRRQLYGKPGCYRKTDYGVEYRTLSNFWTQNSTLMRAVYHLTEDALYLVKEDNFIDLLMAVNPDNMQEMILQGDDDTALHYIEQVLWDKLSQDTREVLDVLIQERKKGTENAARVS